MKIAGWHKCSFVDYPGKIAVTLFTSGCNMRCYFCHNRAFLVDRPVDTAAAIEEVLAFLDKRRHLIDGVVLTGGEPLIQPRLEHFLRRIRRLRLKIKIDTNGIEADRLASLVELGLVDYVALDLKAPPEKLGPVTGCQYPAEALEKSKRLLMQSYLEYEFRVTVLPEFSAEDVLAIGRSAAGARRFVLQQFKKPEGLQADCDPRLQLAAHPPRFFLALEREMRGWFEELILRNVDLRDSNLRHPTAFDPLESLRARAVGE